MTGHMTFILLMWVLFTGGLLWLRKRSRATDVKRETASYTTIQEQNYLDGIVVVDAQQEYEETLTFAGALPALGHLDNQVAALCAERDVDTRLWLARKENEMHALRAEWMLKIHQTLTTDVARIHAAV